MAEKRLPAGLNFLRDVWRANRGAPTMQVVEGGVAQRPVGIGSAFEDVGEALDLPFRAVGDATYDLTGSPLAATAAYTGSQMVNPASLARGAAAVGRGVKGAGLSALRLVDDAMMSGRLPVSPAFVVKPKGGNWLSGLRTSPEHLIKQLKNDPGIAPEQLENYFVASELRDRVRQNLHGAEFQDYIRAADDPSILSTADQLRAAGLFDVYKQRYGTAQAVNDWAEKKLLKYIKNEMATPEDPVRLLAEKRSAEKLKAIEKQQGVIKKLEDKLPTLQPHQVPIAQNHIRRETRKLKQLKEASVLHTDSPWNSRPDLSFERRSNGFPEEGMGVSKAAKDWEDLADVSVNVQKVKHVHGSYDAENPWLFKVDPETAVHSLHKDNAQYLGFPHLIDELRNAIDRTSGLPPELLLGVDDLARMDTAAAVNHVAKINDWRAAQQATANLQRANSAAVKLHKEYPGDPQGMRWVEFKLPEAAAELPQGYSVEKEGKYFYVRDNKGQALKDRYDRPIVANTAEEMNMLAAEELRQSALKDAMGYEGELMNHCVSGSEYCNKVSRGEGRVFSLRDAEGQPYATIETGYSPQFEKEWGRLTEAERKQIHENAPRWAGDEQLREVGMKLFPDKFSATVPESIYQIKGVKNGPIAPEYQKYVQDFVRSQPWGDVQNLENAGLYNTDLPSSLGMFLPQAEDLRNINGRRTDYLQRAKEAGLFNQRYMTRDEWENVLRQQLVNEGQLPPPVEKAAGGPVEYDHEAVARLADELHNSVMNPVPAEPQGYAGGGLVKKLVQAATKTAVKEPAAEVNLARRGFVLPETGITDNLPAVLGAQDLPSVPMSRRSFLKSTAAQAARAALPRAVTAPLAKLAEEQIMKEVVPKVNPEVTAGALNLVQNAAKNYGTSNLNRLDLIMRYAAPEGMTPKEFLRELSKDPKTYDKMMKDVEALNGLARVSYTDDFLPAGEVLRANPEGEELLRASLDKGQREKEAYFSKLRANQSDLPDSTLARESKLWDKYGGNFPYDAKVKRIERKIENVGVDPKIIDGMRNYEKNVDSFFKDIKEQSLSFGDVDSATSKKLYKVVSDGWGEIPLENVRKALPKEMRALPDEEISSLLNSFYDHLRPVAQRYEEALGGQSWYRPYIDRP